MNWWIIAHWWTIDCDPDLYKIEFPVYPTETYILWVDHTEYVIMHDTDYLVLAGPMSEMDAHYTLLACPTMQDVQLYQYLKGVSADE